jgi:hypothetical protein
VGGFLVDVLKALQEFRYLSEDCSSKDIQFILQLNFRHRRREATRSVGRSHSSDEVFVMKVERRASVIQSQYFETTQKENDDKRNDKVIAY